MKWWRCPAGRIANIGFCFLGVFMETSVSRLHATKEDMYLFSIQPYCRERKMFSEWEAEREYMGHMVCHILHSKILPILPILHT